MLLREDVFVVESANASANTDDDRVVTEIPTNLTESTNNQNNIHINQEDNEGESIQQSLDIVDVNSSQLKVENVLRFPLKNVTVDGERSSFLRPFTSDVKITLDIAQRLKYMKLREAQAIRWRYTDAVSSNRKDSLKYFPIIVQNKHNTTLFPCSTVESIDSESQNLREAQGEAGEEKNCGNSGVSVQRTTTSNIQDVTEATYSLKNENGGGVLEGGHDLFCKIPITLSESESSRNIQDKEESEHNNSTSSLSVLAPGSESMNSREIEQKDIDDKGHVLNTTDIERGYCTEILEIPYSFENEKKSPNTDFECHITREAETIDLLKLFENSKEFQDVLDEQKLTGSTFPCLTDPLTKLQEKPSEEIKTLTYQEDQNELNYLKATAELASSHPILFPLMMDNKNSMPQSHKFPSGLKQIKANFLNANILANDLTEFSTCHFCHHSFMPPSSTNAETTTSTTTMTHYPVSNSGHARGIQVQYNDQLLNTIENGPDLIEIINYCVRQHECEQQKQEQQHINDAKLATAPIAKNTTAATMSSQNNDEHNISDDRREPQLDIQLSAHKLLGKYDERTCLASTTAPPPMSEILAELLQQAKDLVDAIGTLNKQTYYADSQQLRKPPTPATCSDIRDSSSQEVSQIREDGVSVKVVAPRTLPEEIKQVKYEYDLELLPKFYALEIDDSGDELIWSEVEQLSEYNSVNFVYLKNARHSANDAKENVDLRIPEQQTEVLNDVAVTSITENEKTSTNIFSEFSVNEDNCEHNTDEMKFEMKNAKSKLPEIEVTRRHSVTYKNEPNIESLRAGGQRPASLVLNETTRSPFTDSKYGRVNESNSGALRSAPTAVPLSVKYGRTNEHYSGSKLASTTPLSAVKDSNTPLIDTKYRQSNDETANLTRSTRAYLGQRTGNLDQKLAKQNDTQSEFNTAIPLHTTGSARSVTSTPAIDTKYNRIKSEPSATKYSNIANDNSRLGPKSYESTAKLSNLSTHATSRPGYNTSPVEDSKYGKNESSATNRSSLLLVGGRAASASTFNELKYPIKQDELSNARSINTASSTLDSKFPKTNDESSATKISRADGRISSLYDSKYAKTNDESSAPRLPHSAARLADTTPLVELRNVRSYVETPIVSGDKGRSISVDDLGAGLSRSTRLRRQRRMHSQGSQDQGEDPIERLNRLRARISGALTEVKGVLKHYSTETEPEVEVAVEEQKKKHGDIAVIKNDDVPKVEPKQEITQPPQEENEGPIKFRFVRKLRRRSFFDEDDEDKAKHEQELAKLIETEKSNELNKDTDGELKKETESESKKEFELKEEAMSVEKEGDLREMNEINEFKSEKIAKEEIKSEEPRCEQNISIGSIDGTIPELIISKPTDEVVSEEKTKVIPISENIQEIDVPKHFEENQESIQEPTPSTSPDGTSPKKPKKKLIVKKAVDRRASIAAVEESKIEPPITPTLSLNLKTQRRPSDSEAVVKKKVTPKITATGETATKVKIIQKVKRPSVKRTNASPTDQNKAITSELAAAPTAVLQSVNNNSISSTNDINGQANFSNKDATIVATTLAPQSMIDDASLTIATTTTPAIATTTTSTITTTRKDDSMSLPTIEREKANAVIVAATPLSPLQTSETNGQLISVSTTQKLVGEAVAVGLISKITKTPTTPEEIIPPKIPKIDNSNARPLIIADNKICELLKLPAAEKVVVKADIQVREAEKPIDQKVIPADRTVIKEGRSDVPNAQQQVCNDSTVLQQAPVTFTSKPPSAIRSEIAKETLSTSPLTPPSTTVESIQVDDTKAGSTATEINSAETTSPSVTSTSVTATTAGAEAMPELQVKTLQAFLKPLVPAPFNIIKDECIKKKTVVKKLLRKNSTEKSSHKADVPKVSESQEHLKDDAIKDKSKKSHLTNDENANTSPSLEPEISPIIEKLPFVVSVNQNDEANDEDWIGEINAEEEEEVIAEEPVPEKKKRCIKKKVIIKRQPRKLSISDTFFKGPDSEPTSPIEEILEKPVSFVKIDTDEEDEYEEIVKPLPPTKSCLKLREFQVGDRVMYAERFRKTQVRWKKGIVLERITSISYKLEVEGKEVPAHISYIKKYTDRKVNFSGKEYLEINYEQIAEEEEQARRYSIWNMV